MQLTPLPPRRTYLLDSSPLTNHTNRPSDYSSLLRQLYEVSIELYDVVNASSFLDKFLLSSPEKELNSTERSALLTNLCVFELQRGMYYDARGSCQRAVELDPSSNTTLVMAADLEMLLGNYTFASVFYDRALKIANEEGGEGSSRATAQLSFQVRVDSEPQTGFELKTQPPLSCPPPPPAAWLRSHLARKAQ